MDPDESTPTPPQGTQAAEPFRFAPSFHYVGDTGTFRASDFEAEYARLFSEALDAGPISAGERQRLDLAASALCLPVERIEQIEAALRAAVEAKASITRTGLDPIATAPYGALTDTGQMPSMRVPAAAREPSPTPADETPPDGALALHDTGETADGLDTGETFDGESSTEDEGPPTLRTGPNAPVTSDAPSVATHPSGIPAVRGAWSEEEELHERFMMKRLEGGLDEQYCTAAVLVRRGLANVEENELYRACRTGLVPNPAAPLTLASWLGLLAHPQQDRTTSEILGCIAPAALLARVSAMRIDGVLPKLDPKKVQDPATTTVSAARALGWCAATLGLTQPLTYVDPDAPSGFEVLPTIPPATRIGREMLAGKSAVELAFHGARHLTWYREEYFICTLVPALTQLEDVFLAALLLGDPTLDFPPGTYERAALNRDALAPLLEPARVARLGELVARFLDEGGRTNLQRWARSAELTACRAGLLLSGDLETAAQIVLREPLGSQRLAELESFWASDAATELRRELGIALAN